jgi:hypothetical protein
MTKPRQGANYGIQADTVQAKNLAVGQNARATYVERASPEVDQALQDLRDLIERLGLADSARALLTSDVEAIESEMSEEEPKTDRIGLLLKGLADKLKMVGAVAKEGANCIEPIKKIASAVGLGLAVLGL